MKSLRVLYDLLGTDGQSCSVRCIAIHTDLPLPLSLSFSLVCLFSFLSFLLNTNHNKAPSARSLQPRNKNSTKRCAGQSDAMQIPLVETLRDFSAVFIIHITRARFLETSMPQ